MVAEPALSFAGLLRRLRAGAKLTQEELAAAAGVSPRSVSNLERGVNRTAHKDTAVLLAGALGLTGPAAELFVAAARGNVPAAQVLAAADGARPRPGAVTGSPYRGLAAFGEQDAAFFFGREAATAQVLDRMSRLLAGTGLLMVSGVSGAGKSSLLRAGMLPRIRECGLAAAPGAASWPRVVFTPTHAPLDELALRVAVLAGTDASAVRRGLDTSPEGFALPARQAALARPAEPAGDGDGSAAVGGQPSLQRRLLLVVDQFEELFTQCPDEGQRRAFITALHAAATARHGPDQAPAALVALGVRADFEARCADYPELADAVQDRYLVTAMTGRQLRMAITEPAKKADSGVDDDLVEVLLAEVRTGQPGTFGAGMLPLLSHALDQAWRSRAGQVLALADYERTGGIDGAVAASAQRAYERLTPAQQSAARQVFTRLTATSAEGVDYRRPRDQGGADRRQEPSRGPGRRGCAGGLRRRTAAHPGRRHRGDQPRGTPDRLAAAARHLARPTPTPTGSCAPGCVPPPPSGPASPATGPTSIPAACWPQRPTPRPGSAPIPPAIRRSARPSVTSCAPAATLTGGAFAGGRQWSLACLPSPWSLSPPPGSPRTTPPPPRTTPPAPATSMPSPCPASSPPKASTSTAPIA